MNKQKISIRAFSRENPFPTKNYPRENLRAIKFLLENLKPESLNITNENFARITSKEDFSSMLKDVVSSAKKTRSKIFWFPGNHARLAWRQLLDVFSSVFAGVSVENFNYRFKQYDIFALGIYFDPIDNYMFFFPKFPPHFVIDYSVNPPVHKVKENLLSSICYEFSDYILIDPLKKFSVPNPALWVVSFYDPRYSGLSGKLFNPEFPRSINIRKELKNHFENSENLFLLGVNYTGSFVYHVDESKLKKISFFYFLRREHSSISEIKISLDAAARI